jgi:hypothetical protein
VSEHPTPEQLHRFADGELHAGELALVEGHLRECFTCSREVHRLYGLARLTARAPRGVRPEADPWPGIVESAARKGLVRGGERSWGFRRAGGVGLAAAAVLAALLLRPGTERPGPPEAHPAPRAAGGGQPAAPPIPSDTAEDGGLMAEFQARKPFLQPETIGAVERNLATIERAIEDTRRALENDPGNAHLAEMLRRSRQEKIGYLQAAISLTSL